MVRGTSATPYYDSFFLNLYVYRAAINKQSDSKSTIKKNKKIGPPSIFTKPTNNDLPQQPTEKKVNFGLPLEGLSAEHMPPYEAILTFGLITAKSGSILGVP
jgi:hypothetical protein